jgi:hypothetical protein
MSSITWSVDFTGTPDEVDLRAAEMIVDEENAWRAAQDPPVAALPFGIAAEKKSSSITVVAKRVTNQWNSYREAASEVKPDVRQLWIDATDTQRAAALIALQT